MIGFLLVEQYRLHQRLEETYENFHNADRFLVLVDIQYLLMSLFNSPTLVQQVSKLLALGYIGQLGSLFHE